MGRPAKGRALHTRPLVLVRAASTSESPVRDKSARQRTIARSIWLTVPGTLAVLGLAALLPAMSGMDELNRRMAMTLGWLLVALLPYVASCLHIAAARFFEGSHDPLAGAESERLRIHCRVMQNTLEQLVWFAFSALAFAAFASPGQMRLVPVACGFFAFARFVYWWGYLRSATLGRAPGVQMTFTLNVTLFVYAIMLAARQLAW
ncbi:MAPEG family protein [Aquincola sp. S2]|uniref:MAPEG family protein n=1 Tax=Pseudaquabacterium terrae TaxID=2732868 RepID=A0ABX2EFB5_9BURK|nr:MAPEG family protein [Aquabacterium terrae]NRF67285.1 MAPEG family protein [Aquabacterium terrae]